MNLLQVENLLSWKSSSRRQYLSKKKKKKLFQLHCRTRVLVFLIMEFPVEALLWCVPSLFIGCIRTNCGTKYPLILTPQVSIIHVCFLSSFCSIFCVMMPAVRSVEVIGPWYHSSRRSQGQEVHPQCTATSYAPQTPEAFLWVLACASKSEFHLFLLI